MNGQPLTPELLIRLECQVVGDNHYEPLPYGDLISRYGRDKAEVIQHLRCGYAYFAAKQAFQNSL